MRLSRCCCWPVFEQEHLTAGHDGKMGTGSKAGLDLLEESPPQHLSMTDPEVPQSQVSATQPLGDAAGCC